MTKPLSSLTKAELMEEVHLLRTRISTLEYEKSVWVGIHQQGGDQEFRISNLEKALFEDHYDMCWRWESDMEDPPKRFKKLLEENDPCPLCRWMFMQEKIEEFEVTQGSIEEEKATPGGAS